MSALWQQFADLFPHRWTPALGIWAPDNPAVNTWRSTLKGLTPKQLARGIERVRLSGATFPPSAPEFRKLCIGDIPDEHVAYLEAVRAVPNWSRHEWSHPVVYVAAAECGTWELGHSSEREGRAAFRACYRRAVERFNAGEKMTAPEPLPRIGRPERRRADPAVERAALDEIAAMFKATEKAAEKSDLLPPDPPSPAAPVATPPQDAQDDAEAVA